MSEWTPEQAEALLAVARSAIGSAVGEGPSYVPDEGWLAPPRATFVTIFRNGALHGCVGSLEPRRSLGNDVHDNAIAAAMRDPRSRPLRREELDDIRVEVSVLSPLSPMRFSSEADALSQLRPGEDGVLFQWGSRRATFLPQVWEQLPEPAQFMSHLKLKAGLASDFWADDVELSRYHCDKFREPDTSAQGAS